MKPIKVFICETLNCSYPIKAGNIGKDEIFFYLYMYSNRLDFSFIAFIDFNALESNVEILSRVLSFSL